MLVEKVKQTLTSEGSRVARARHAPDDDDQHERTPTLHVNDAQVKQIRDRLEKLDASSKVRATARSSKLPITATTSQSASWSPAETRSTS